MSLYCSGSLELLSHGNPMQAFSQLFSRTCFKLNSWCWRAVNKVESALIDTEAYISNLELSDYNFNSHFLLIKQYTKPATLQHQCNIKWAYGASLLRIKDGEKNTNFFNSITCIPLHFNFIFHVKFSKGNVFCNCVDIGQAFLNFYNTLWITLSASYANVVDVLPNNLPRISDINVVHPTWEVTKEEVYLTILDLPIGKSPSPNGFNIVFY